MRRAGKRTVGIVAIGLLVAMLLASVFGTSIVMAPHAGSSSNAVAASHGSGLGMAAHPAPVAPAAPGAAYAAVGFVGTLGTYTVLPSNIEVHIIVLNSSISTNTSLWVTVTDKNFNTYCTTASGNKTVTGGYSYYNFSLNPVALGGVTFTNCPYIQSDPVIFNATVYTLNNTTGQNSSWTAYSAVTLNTSIVYSPLSVSLLIPEGAVGAGNITFVASYPTQYVTSVRMVVTNPSGTTVLFNSSLMWLTSTSPAVGTWFEQKPGVYPYHLTIVAAYGSFVKAGNVTVLVPGGGTVYSNTSSWKNASIFSGLSGAVSGTILLVVGLIVGMIVALVVGRSLMRPAPAAPAQPWQPAAGAPAANTCSVCGKSFATPEELKDHAKSEHGMTS